MWRVTPLTLLWITSARLSENVCALMWRQRLAKGVGGFDFCGVGETLGRRRIGEQVRAGGGWMVTRAQVHRDTRARAAFPSRGVYRLGISDPKDFSSVSPLCAPFGDFGVSLRTSNCYSSSSGSA